MYCDKGRLIKHTVSLDLENKKEDDSPAYRRYNRIQRGRLAYEKYVKVGVGKVTRKVCGGIANHCFFMFLFYTIVLFFGISYAILVSVVTILFKVNYRKHLTMRQLLTLIGTQFLMAMLAFCLAGTDTLCSL